MSQRQVLVIDNGSTKCKAGFSGDPIPKTIFPSVVGRESDSKKKILEKEAYIGEEALSKKELLNLKYPVEFGMIVNWDDMEKLWYYTFKDELKVSPENHPVLLTEAPLNPRVSREKMTQIMFETFSTPSLYVAVPAVLSLFASGLSIGVVLDSGDAITHSVPIYEGCRIQNNILHLNIAGRDLNEYLMKLLVEKGDFQYKSIKKQETLAEIKETLCYVSLDFDKDIKSDDVEKVYQLPDGNKIKLNNETFKCPESLFKSNLLCLNINGIQEILYHSIEKCHDIDVRKDLYQNIVLSGGTCMFEGMVDRMTKEIVNLAPSSTKVKVSSSKGIYSAWIGGSMLSSLSDFQQMSISKDEYEEIGPSIIHRKCF